MMARASSVAQPRKIRTDRSEGLPLGKVSFIDRGRGSLPATGSVLGIGDSRRMSRREYKRTLSHQRLTQGRCR